MKYIFEKIDLDTVFNDEKRFNSNNHWDTPPDDYIEKLESSNTRHWIDKFHNEYVKIVINHPLDLMFLKSAHEICKYTGKFTNLYNDELEDLLKRYDNPTFAGVFVRAENVSLKDGEYGKGPYTSLNMIIKSLVSCSSTHTPINSKTESITLYLIPWVEIDVEFRIFVNNNRITCISQQDFYKKLNLNHLIKCEKIIEYFNTTIKHKINKPSFSYDFAFLTDGTPYFIEPNSFGKEYAAGSSLFHWLVDEEKLYGENSEGEVYVRYIG